MLSSLKSNSLVFSFDTPLLLLLTNIRVLETRNRAISYKHIRESSGRPQQLFAGIPSLSFGQWRRRTKMAQFDNEKRRTIIFSEYNFCISNYSILSLKLHSTKMIFGNSSAEHSFATFWSIIILQLLQQKYSLCKFN